MADDDRVGGGDLGEGRPEQLGQRLVPLVRDHSAHVVRLHDLRQIYSHGPTFLKVLLSRHKLPGTVQPPLWVRRVDPQK
ncbi:hypothetical protein GCM10010226_43800 [Streptomyces phaeofaciens]|uniref:Uncharacterized protein n=1 Tax=Streptomyces phaeofaciens TaxID=68254 RepID=A0A918LWU5_9ACTN|nr:hypothetical protein GCM10010226_43800 [Streptomyces phaeofaciens]